MLSEEQVRGILGELCGAFGRPFGADDNAMVSAWRRALNDCEPDEVRYAALRLTREADKFPTPKAVRTLAFWHRGQKLAQARAQQRADHPDEDIPFCSRCNARTLYDDPWGRMRPRHADNCPGLHPEDLEIQRLSLARDSTRLRSPIAGD
jgi:hypothetical protein